MPHDARRLIESVYGTDASDRIPVGLAPISQAAGVQASRQGGVGILNAISPSAAYE